MVVPHPPQRTGSNHRQLRRHRRHTRSGRSERRAQERGADHEYQSGSCINACPGEQIHEDGAGHGHVQRLGGAADGYAHAQAHERLGGGVQAALRCPARAPAGTGVPAWRRPGRPSPPHSVTPSPPAHAASSGSGQRPAHPEAGARSGAYGLAVPEIHGSGNATTATDPKASAPAPVCPELPGSCTPSSTVTRAPMGRAAGRPLRAISAQPRHLRSFRLGQCLSPASLVAWTGTPAGRRASRSCPAGCPPKRRYHDLWMTPSRQRAPRPHGSLPREKADSSR